MLWSLRTRSLGILLALRLSHCFDITQGVLVSLSFMSHGFRLLYVMDVEIQTWLYGCNV